MQKRTYEWTQIGTEYRLTVEEEPGYYSVSLSLGDDVSVLRNNPITIHIRLDKMDDHDSRRYQMAVDGLAVRNIARVDAIKIAKALNCELTEQCDKCKDIAPLTYSQEPEYTHVCVSCL